MKYTTQTDPKCRWSSQLSYRLIIWAWMMNEISVMYGASYMSHFGFYLHAILYVLSAIFIGLPLVYSEVCITQYTNCSGVAMWNYFPLLRGVGYSAIFIVILRSIYVMILSIWYLEYAVYSATDTPPWFTCEDFDDTYCMVKRINISVYQHCLETQILFQEDCGMRTASFCFFQREIGHKNTMVSMSCMFAWRPLIISGIISLTLFLFSIKNERFVQFFVKILAFYVAITIFILLIISLSQSGSWYSFKTITDLIWENMIYSECLRPVTLGFLSLGTGYGILSHVSRDIPFRSNAMMAAVSTSLFSICSAILMSLIIFSGIRTMSFYHGEEENIIEYTDSIFFFPLASVSEILSYFDAITMWSLIWFSSIFLCLYVVLWIQYLYLKDLLINNFSCAKKYQNLTSAILSFLLSVLSWPFLCSDLTATLSDSTEILQICNSLLFSISLYWIYGYKKHSVDIVFMIGIKSSYFWKICWVLNPILIMYVLYAKLHTWRELDFEDSYEILSLEIRFDDLIFLVYMYIYGAIIVIATLYEIFLYWRHDKVIRVVLPCRDWGPVNQTLFRSRKMFVPEIMTREFLYRQVRIHDQKQGSKTYSRRCKNLDSTSENASETVQWSVVTSN